LIVSSVNGTDHAVAPDLRQGPERRLRRDHQAQVACARVSRDLEREHAVRERAAVIDDGVAAVEPVEHLRGRDDGHALGQRRRDQAVGERGVAIVVVRAEDAVVAFRPLRAVDQGRDRRPGYASSFSLTSWLTPWYTSSRVPSRSAKRIGIADP
jgi:hypothetical protein